MQRKEAQFEAVLDESYWPSALGVGVWCWWFRVLHLYELVENVAAVALKLTSAWSIRPCYCWSLGAPNPSERRGEGQWTAALVGSPWHSRCFTLWDWRVRWPTGPVARGTVCVGCSRTTRVSRRSASKVPNTFCGPPAQLVRRRRPFGMVVCLRLQGGFCALLRLVCSPGWRGHVVSQERLSARVSTTHSPQDTCRVCDKQAP